MKRILILVAIATFLASCGSSRHTCDAYSDVQQTDSTNVEVG